MTARSPTPRSPLDTAFGPIINGAGVPAMSPESRTARLSNPSLTASEASSTCVRLRTGPRTRRFEISRLRGPMMPTVPGAAKLPSWESGRSKVLFPVPADNNVHIFAADAEAPATVTAH